MAELKTKPNDASVEAFLATVSDEQQRSDCAELQSMMEDITGGPAQMWGTSIVGFGNHRYRYKSGREGDWFLVGFSPRKQSLSLYIMTGFEHYEELLSKLGKYKTGKSCLYVKRLSDIDRKVLHALVQKSVEFLQSRVNLNQSP